MKVKCAHCSQEHDVPGVVSRESLTTQVAAKQAEIDLLTKQITDYGDVAALRRDLEAARSELDQVKTQGQVDAAFRSSGVPEDAAVRAGFRAIYDSQMAGLEADKRTPYHEWLGSEAAQAHPLLRPHYQGQQGHGQGQPPGATGATGATGAPPGRMAGQGQPQGDNGAAPPPVQGGGLKTAEDVARYLQSPEYRALPLDQQRARRQELQSQHGLGGLFQRQALPSVGGTGPQGPGGQGA